ncbi:hypothetical protein HMI56_006531, partial [Coelomomyces lativittatus]
WKLSTHEDSTVVLCLPSTLYFDKTGFQTFQGKNAPWMTLKAVDESHPPIRHCTVQTSGEHSTSTHPTLWTCVLPWHSQSVHVYFPKEERTGNPSTDPYPMGSCGSCSTSTASSCSCSCSWMGYTFQLIHLDPNEWILACEFIHTQPTCAWVVAYTSAYRMVLYLYLFPFTLESAG